jgi:hypothetical protein
VLILIIRIYKLLTDDEKALKTLMDQSTRLKKKYHQCREIQENDEHTYVRAKNDPMSDPKSLTLLSQTAEKSKKIAEDARREYQTHLEKSKEEHPILISNIQKSFNELQKFEWERLNAIARILDIFVGQVLFVLTNIYRPPFSLLSLFFFFLISFFMFLTHQYRMKSFSLTHFKQTNN